MLSDVVKISSKEPSETKIKQSDAPSEIRGVAERALATRENSDDSGIFILTDFTVIFQTTINITSY